MAGAGRSSIFASMKTDYTVIQAERRFEWEREELFRSACPIFHLYSSPIESQVIITNPFSRDLSITYMAVAAHETGVVVLAYAVMSNHFHFILKGSREKCQAFFVRFRSLLDIYLSRTEKITLFKTAVAGLTEITSLKQFRNEVAYVLRNPYVARTDINPILCEWTSAGLYFNPGLTVRGKAFAELTIREKRALFKATALSIPDNWRIIDTHVDPASFVDYRFVESMFTHTRQFINTLLKNVEAQVEIAISHNEAPVIPDEELLPMVLRLCHDLFYQEGTRSLQDYQKKQLAREVRNHYHANVSQLARLVGLSQKELQSMFPDTR